MTLSRRKFIKSIAIGIGAAGLPAMGGEINLILTLSGFTEHSYNGNYFLMREPEIDGSGLEESDRELIARMRSGKGKWLQQLDNNLNIGSSTWLKMQPAIIRKLNNNA